MRIRLSEYIDRLQKHLVETDGPESIVLCYKYYEHTSTSNYIGVFKNGQHRHYSSTEGSRSQELRDWTWDVYIKKTIRAPLPKFCRKYKIPYCKIDFILDD